MKNTPVSAKTIRVIKVEEDELRGSLTLSETNEISAATVETSPDGSAHLVLTFVDRG